MRATIKTMLVLALVLWAASTARAEGWQMPNLNPFGNNGNAAPSNGSSKSWLPSWKGNSNGTGTKVWNKMKQAPSDMANGTKRAMNAVNPFKGASNTNHSRPLTGSNLDKTPPAKKWLPSWGASEEDNTPPQTVSDFIAGPRPE